jgi:hypothetical protein
MFKAADTPIVFTVCAIAVYFCSNHSIFQLLMQPAVYVLKVATASLTLPKQVVIVK